MKLIMRVKDCPLCEIFDKQDIHTKLYYPNSKEEVKDSEFVIIECDSCHTPMMVYSEHVTSVSKEQYGRILYIIRKLFGNVKLRKIPRTITDHIHYHIIK